MRELSKFAAAAQRSRGVGDSAANVRRDLTDHHCGDGRDCELCCFSEQAAGPSASLFLLVAAAEPRGSDNPPPSQLFYSVARRQRNERRQTGI